ncbi:MAG: DUF4126 domain-containing protein, partial [Gemmatimonadota bacterium]|nr:DUF4126 domain-containing protein [Gemmatimonadota bacterium]
MPCPTGYYHSWGSHVNGLMALLQSLGVAYAGGVNIYATVAVLGLAQRLGWVGSLPGSLGVVAHTWVIVLATTLYAIEFTATLVPGIASLWDTLHTFIRPIAATVLALSSVWGDSSSIVA